MLPKNLLMPIAFLFVILLQHIQISSQTQNPNTEIGPFTDLTFEIETTKSTILPYQPIPIVLKISNQTENLVQGYGSLDFDTHPFYLYIQKGDDSEKTQIYPLTTISAFVAVKNSIVPVGKTVKTNEWISLSLGKYCSEPGVYQLSAVLRNSNRKKFVESNKIEFVIQKPSNSNLEVYNLIKNSGTAEYLFSDAEFSKKRILLEKISNSFPESLYAESASFILGEQLFRNKNYEEGLTYLEKLENKNDFIFAEKVKDYLTETRQQLKSKLQ